jgi:hypothetical protein
MVTRILSAKRLPDWDAIPAVREWILSELRTAIVNSRYGYGIRLETANLMLDELEIATEDALQYDCRRKSVEERLTSWQGRYKETQKSCKARIAEWKEAQDEKTAELSSAHEAQLKQFERDWADPLYLAQFCKPSVRLLSLRERGSNLAILGEFKETKSLKREY